MNKTDFKQENYINSLVHIEVLSAKSGALEWPSLFSNLIEPRKKDLPSARAFYDSLTNEEIETRIEIHSWESDAWNIYEGLVGYSFTPLSKSIEPRRWAKKEVLNIELLFQEGKNQLMTSKDFREGYTNKIPELYNQLLIGEWESFISTDELRRFHKAESDYLKDHNIDVDNLTNVDFNVFMARPWKEQFINTSYFVAQEVQSLVWYREFLTEVMFHGLTFYPDHESEDEQTDKPKRKYIDTKKPQRTNNGFEAIKASFDEFVAITGRFPQWTELMAYMSNNSPPGFEVDASYNGDIVSGLHIAGVENPIDRDAFRNRYNRYFKKTDIKLDIK